MKSAHISVLRPRAFIWGRLSKGLFQQTSVTVLRPECVIKEARAFPDCSGQKRSC
ncbi:hypothetical protein Agau_C201145 [Agrobacterium tumefaciens F2]|nr:hypothetical protein Agau_C201145 [Agrobacterium tumefaciens F2]